MESNEWSKLFQSIGIRKHVVYIVGLGPGTPELITLKAYSILNHADVCLYTGTLLSPELKQIIQEKCKECYDTGRMDVEDIVNVIVENYRKGRLVAWFHDGCPTVYGGLWPILARLRELGIPYEIVPGVTSVSAAAAVLGIELTVPEKSQTVIITRVSKRTPKPANEDLSKLAKCGTVVLLLSVQNIEQVYEELRKGGLDDNVDVAIVQYATWRDKQKVIKCKLGELVKRVKEEHINRCAVIIVGPCVSDSMWNFTHLEYVYSKDRKYQQQKSHEH